LKESRTCFNVMGFGSEVSFTWIYTEELLPGTDRN